MYAVDGWPAVKDSERPVTTYDGKYDGTNDWFECKQTGIKSEHPSWNGVITSGHCVAKGGYIEEEGLKPFDVYLRPFVSKDEGSLGGITCSKGKFFLMNDSGVAGDPWTCVDIPGSKSSFRSKNTTTDDQGYVQGSAQDGSAFKMSKYDTIWETKDEYEARLESKRADGSSVGDHLIGFKVGPNNVGSVSTRVPHMRNAVLDNAALDTTRGNCPFTVYPQAGSAPTTKAKIYNGACCKATYFDKRHQPQGGILGTGEELCPVDQGGDLEDSDCVEWHYKHMVNDKFACDTSRMHLSLPGFESTNP